MAQAHVLLDLVAPGTLAGLKETAQGSALIFVQVAEEFLRVELSALTFGGTGVVTALAIRASPTPFTARGIVAARVIAAGVARSGFATGFVIRAELAARGAWTVSGGRCGPVLAGAFLADGGQGGE
jgi:hypothetical protein